MRQINVLLTGAGGASGINCINALRSQNEMRLSIIGVDADAESAGLYLVDSHYKIPDVKNNDYIPRILDICAKEKIDVILPTYSGEILLLANCLDDFNALDVKLLIPKSEVIQIFNDKWLTYKFFRENGVSTPTTWLLSSFNDDDLSITYPLYLKPVWGSGAKENWKVNSVEDIEYFRRNLKKPYIIQNYIKAREFTVDSLSSPKFVLMTAIIRERLRVKDGKSMAAETCQDDRVIPIIEKIIKKSKIVGPFNIQYFLTEDDSLLFFELNPRFAAGGLALATKVGINIPLMTIKIALGMDVSPMFNYLTGIKMLRYLTEIFLDNNGFTV